jgi:hypothetical protein
VGPKADLEDVEKRKFLTLTQLKLRPFRCPDRSQSLYRLRYPGSPKKNTSRTQITNIGKAPTVQPVHPEAKPVYNVSVNPDIHFSEFRSSGSDEICTNVRSTFPLLVKAYIGNSEISSVVRTVLSSMSVSETHCRILYLNPNDKNVYSILLQKAGG